MADKRPTIAMGHIVAKTVNIEKTTKFYLALGSRKVWQNEFMSIVELRGGTHILFFKQKGKFKKAPTANFDFMVDDVKKFHAKIKKAKLPASPLREHKQSGHQLFETKDPDGRVICIYSSHTEGRLV